MYSEQENIGNRLKEVRKRLELTIRQISQQAEISESFLSEIERGIKRPSSVYLFYLATKLNVNINWVFSDKGEMFVPGDDKSDQDKIDDVIAFLNQIKKKF